MQLDVLSLRHVISLEILATLLGMWVHLVLVTSLAACSSKASPEEHSPDKQGNQDQERQEQATFRSELVPTGKHWWCDIGQCRRAKDLCQECAKQESAVAFTFVSASFERPIHVNTDMATCERVRAEFMSGTDVVMSEFSQCTLVGDRDRVRPTIPPAELRDTASCISYSETQDQQRIRLCFHNSEQCENTGAFQAARLTKYGEEPAGPVVCTASPSTLYVMSIRDVSGTNERLFPSKIDCERYYEQFSGFYAGVYSTCVPV